MEAKKPSLLQSLLIAVVVMVIIIVIVVGLTVLKLPYWPAIFFLFAITQLSKVTKEGWVDTSVGGLIGLLAGLSSLIVGNFLGATVGLIVLVILVILLITLLVSGKFKYANLPCFFVLTAVSVFVDKFTIDQVIPIFISFLIGVALFGVVVLVLSSTSKKKAK